jgi:hypothetical protein
MFVQAAFRTAVRFGVLAALASWVVLLGVYFAGLNPYGKAAFYALFLLPVFLFIALAYYKKHAEPELKFWKGLRVSWLTTLVAAVTFSMLVYLFSVVAGAEALQAHIQEMKAMMVQSKAQFLKLPNGKQAYELNYNALDQITPGSLVIDNFLKMLIIGFLFSFVSATFSRK